MAMLSDVITDRNDELHLPDDVIDDIREIINRRFTTLVDNNPVYKATLFLHPGYIGTPILRKRDINPFAGPSRASTASRSAPRPDDDLRRAFPYYVEVGKFLGEQLKVHVQANQPSAVFLGFATAQDVAAAFQRQFIAYTRQQAPFNISEGEPLRYWRKLVKDEDAKVLAFLGVKLFSILPNSMAEERTMSLITHVNGPLRAAMKPATIVNFVRVKQHNDRAKRRVEKVPTILRFRDLAAHIQAEVLPPSASPSPTSAPATAPVSALPAPPLAPVAAAAAAPAAAATAPAATATAATAAASAPPATTAATSTPVAAPAGEMDIVEADEVDAAFAAVEADTDDVDDDVDHVLVPRAVFVPENDEIDLCSPLLLDLLSSVPVPGATLARSTASATTASATAPTPLNVANVSFFK